MDATGWLGAGLALVGVGCVAWLDWRVVRRLGRVVDLAAESARVAALNRERAEHAWHQCRAARHDATEAAERAEAAAGPDTIAFGRRDL